jgi:hypothetical protein
MGKTPRSQCARLWAWLYVQLFGAPDAPEDDEPEPSREATGATDREPPEDESK